MKKHGPPRFLQALFLLWLGIVNLLYYAQFWGILEARLRPFLRPWR